MYSADQGCGPQSHSSTIGGARCSAVGLRNTWLGAERVQTEACSVMERRSGAFPLSAAAAKRRGDLPIAAQSFSRLGAHRVDRLRASADRTDALLQSVPQAADLMAVLLLDPRQPRLERRQPRSTRISVVLRRTRLRYCHGFRSGEVRRRGDQHAITRRSCMRADQNLRPHVVLHLLRMSRAAAGRSGEVVPQAPIRSAIRGRRAIVSISATDVGGRRH
mmetsp:Transcript_32423/g.93241  ORF Transcript_32423/g.93241 Transcript_32423/m.93241 type:complete len:219 (-) Transcript_32423:703-1359(-)